MLIIFIDERQKEKKVKKEPPNRGTLGVMNSKAMCFQRLEPKGYTIKKISDKYFK
ncbi:MAG: hypothetical protein XD76_1755 [candidate division TA06 bacterium 32_111]|uniref:Uncharacterized protein n=1 Tax=candidate division TA06 bacterium 34_109 TaxID=1635277 RepID=A0A124FZX9_UNCT6|nr:MAG: hypothetical protein XD76_1755 [candidate division TA06 bacterium 32_111]KUK85647.1 MAG: hypothetical protein XE03_1956 [candidate division TA06 bacterium 34_109]